MGEVAVITKEKLAILRCPVCKTDLTQDGDYLVCAGEHSFPVINGIVIFLTNRDVADFQSETWGSELANEWAEFVPDFSFSSCEDPIQDLRKIHGEAAEKGRASRLYNTGVYPQDWGLPDEVYPALEKSRDELVRLSGAASARAILDWPTGEGYCLHYLARQAHPEALVVALDVNFRTMAKIKPYYEKYGLSDRMLFVAADARKMPFKDGVFQSVTALGGTTEIENTEAGFSETYRVLESGGWFGLSGDQYKEGSPSMEVAARFGLAGPLTKDRLEATMNSIGFCNLAYEVLYQGYDADDDLPDEERCPLPARGDWYQQIVAAGQK